MSREPASGREDVPEEPGGRGGVQGAEGQSQNRLEWGGCPAAPRGARTPVPAGRLLRGGAPVCGMRHPTSRRRCCPSPVCCPCPPTAQAGRPAAPRRLAREPFGAAGRAHGENTDCTVDSPLPGNKQTALIAALPSGLVAVGTAHGLPRASLQSGPQTGLAPGGERLRAPRAAAGPHPPQARARARSTVRRAQRRAPAWPATVLRRPACLPAVLRSGSRPPHGHPGLSLGPGALVRSQPPLGPAARLWSRACPRGGQTPGRPAESLRLWRRRCPWWVRAHLRGVGSRRRLISQSPTREVPAHSHHLACAGAGRRRAWGLR